jgi:hypothetical protein
MPGINGTDTLHCVVPAAVPAPPVLVDHVTEFTPTLSLEVPVNMMLDAEVETNVDEGEVMVTLGGVLSAVVGGPGTGGAGTIGLTGVTGAATVWRVTSNCWDT